MKLLVLNYEFETNVLERHLIYFQILGDNCSGYYFKEKTSSLFK